MHMKSQMVERFSICLDHKTLLLETSEPVAMVRKIILVYSNWNLIALWGRITSSQLSKKTYFIFQKTNARDKKKNTQGEGGQAGGGRGERLS